VSLQNTAIFSKKLLLISVLRLRPAVWRRNISTDAIFYALNSGNHPSFRAISLTSIWTPLTKSRVYYQIIFLQMLSSTKNCLSNTTNLGQKYEPTVAQTVMIVYFLKWAGYIVNTRIVINWRKASAKPSNQYTDLQESNEEGCYDINWCRSWLVAYLKTLLVSRI
jgi:hypothetical protein